MPAPDNQPDNSPASAPQAKLAELPECVFDFGGRLDAAPPPRSTPTTRVTVELVKELGDETVPIFIGKKGYRLRPYNRCVQNVSVLRLGITPTEGLNQEAPHNSEQLVDAGNALVEAGHGFPQVASLLEEDVFTSVPELIADAKLREGMLADAELYVKDLKRGLVSTYNKLDGKIRPYMPILRPLESRPGIGVALKPYYALTQDPADKAKKTLQTFNQGLEQGLQKGHAQGLADARKAAPRAATPATQINVAGVNSGPDAPESESDPAAKTRKRPR